jgi:PAS domain S-box-containing protein
MTTPRRYEHIVRYARDAILVFDGSATIIDVNDAACAAYGYTAAEFRGMSLKNLRPADAIEEFAAQWAAAAAVGGAMFEAMHQRRDGSTFPVEISARVLDLEGEQCGIVFIRDITERRKAEATLREQQDFSRQILDTMLEGCQILGYDWRYRYINAAAEQHNRRRNTELIGRTFIECWPGIEDTEVFAAVARCLEQRSTHQLDVEFVFPDGGVGWFRTVIQPVPEGLAIFSEEITRRKLAEKELRAAEERWRLALDAARMGTFDWILATDQILWSRRHEELFGYAPGEFDGTFAGFARRLHPDDVADMGTEIARCMAMKARFAREYRVVWPDGSVHWIAGTGQFEFDAAGQPCRMVGVVLDITERKQSEQEILRLNIQLQAHATELERRVADRTVELELAKTRAEGADRAKSAFLNTMSHELRTPLNAIVGFTEIMLAEVPGPLNAEQHKQLGIVEDSSRQLLALINDVLDISRVEAGEMRLTQGKFDLAALLATMRDAFTPQVARRELGLSVHLGRGPAIVYGDERRVQQVINNLVSNALKFTLKGSIAISLERRSDHYALTVADTGIGIRPEDVDKLFKPFSQIEGGMRLAREGTGLGLAITKHLVEAMGGSIEVESRWGEGSRFTFTLPAGEAI